MAWPDDVEDLVAEGDAHVLHLLQQHVQDVALAGVGGDQVEDVHVIGLADPVDAAHPLLQPVGVPRDVVVDHQVAELEVDALPGRLGGDHDLGGLPEVAFLLDPLRQLHLAVDLGDLEVLGQVLDQVVEGVLVLGEDQQLLAAVLLQPEAGDHVEKLGQLALGPAVLDLLGQGEQRPQRRRAQLPARRRCPAAIPPGPASSSLPAGRPRRGRQGPRRRRPETPGTPCDCAGRRPGLPAPSRSGRARRSACGGSPACWRRPAAAWSSARSPAVVLELLAADLPAASLETKSVTCVVQLQLVAR